MKLIPVAMVLFVVIAVGVLHFVRPSVVSPAEANAAALQSAGRATQTDGPSALRALLDTQVAAWNRGDIEAFMQGYWKSERTTFAGSGGILRGWQALLQRYRRSYPDRAAMGRLEFRELEISLLAPDSALILGRWRLEREKDSPGGVFTLVARRLPEGWRIVHDHTSAVAPPTR